MTSTINEPPTPPQPVIVGFWWRETASEQAYTYDGDTFPYVEPAPVERYKSYTSPITSTLKFIAKKEPTEEALDSHHAVEGFPIVQAPTGVTILDYLWDFGDGFTGNGPIVSHKYRVLNPEVEVKLTVIDSRGLEWSEARAVNLVFATIGNFNPYRLRG